ncbi:MAG: di-trans,poly-cis-decaprenylcistransferase [Clostridia bacterium]|nr:di-trans,poly-cis-decaprenylcistransferase [Clostridia bacterium]MBQ4323116.1 di-trans,poly-cis-decaprenylcistransferase [Clostridia bacterium]
MNRTNLPTHIGFIMDGNRRWAKEKGKTAPQGHKAGADAMERIVEECYARGIRHITFYAFSTENWTRPPAEVSALMTLFSHYLDKLYQRWQSSEKDVYHHTQVRFIGDLTPFNNDFRRRVERIERLSDEKEIRMHMNIALNYGGRADIVQAVNRALAEGVTQITEQDIAQRLYTAGQPDPDLIVRTGGEMRISNFLLWQTSYSEYYSDPCYWPDFDGERLDLALDAYEARTRKFGGNA